MLQALTVELVADPDFPALIERAREAYAVRRRGLIEALAAHGVEAHGNSGLNVWVPVEDETGVVGALAARGWVLAPGAPFSLASSPPAIRITIATLEQHECERLAADLADVCAPARAARTG